MVRKKLKKVKKFRLFDLSSVFFAKKALLSGGTAPSSQGKTDGSGETTVVRNFNF